MYEPYDDKKYVTWVSVVLSLQWGNNLFLPLRVIASFRWGTGLGTALEFVKYLAPTCSERIGWLRCRHASALCAWCLIHVEVWLSSSHRAEGHCGSLDPLGKETGGCDHPHRLLLECLCPGGPAALQGQPQEQMCQELYSSQWDGQLLLLRKTQVEFLPWGQRSGWQGVQSPCIPI